MPACLQLRAARMSGGHAAVCAAGALQCADTRARPDAYTHARHARATRRRAVNEWLLEKSWGIVVSARSRARAYTARGHARG